LNEQRERYHLKKKKFLNKDKEKNSLIKDKKDTAQKEKILFLKRFLNKDKKDAT